MAPGANGGGRQTGTVPKSKTYNDTSQNHQLRRDRSINTVPNNLISLDWHPVPDASRNHSRKSSNTWMPFPDYSELEGIVSHDLDNRYRHASIDPHLRHHILPSANHLPVTSDNMTFSDDDEQSTSRMDNMKDAKSRGGSWGPRSARQGGHPRRVVTRQEDCAKNVLPDKENKSNITRTPDSNQVVTRLQQIREYIKQTSSLMDALKVSKDPRHTAQYNKLSKMLLDLRDSEQKLEGVLVTLQKYDHSEEELEDQENSQIQQEIPTSQGPRSTPRGSKGSVGYSKTEMSVVNSARGEGESSTGVLKSSDSATRNELRIKVEESQRKLQALQEQQAALLSLQQKAQHQLNEARAAQGALLSQAVVAGTGGRVPVEDLSHNLPDVDALQSRLQSLQEMYDSRNKLVKLMGDPDGEVTDQATLQDKLQELQEKKHHMDILVQQLNELTGGDAGNEVQIQDDKQQNEIGGEPEDEVEFRGMSEKVEELNRMKARLAQLQKIMAQVNPGEQQQNQNSGRSLILHESLSLPDGVEEEQAVNLRRQKEQGRGQHSAKPDNISLSTEVPHPLPEAILHREHEIQKQTAALKEAKLKVVQLQNLLDAVQTCQRQGQVAPEQYQQLKSRVEEIENGRESERKPHESLRQHHNAVLAAEPRSSARDNAAPKHPRERPNSSPPDELTLEAVQAMTRDLQQQTVSLKAERDRLKTAQRQLSKLQQDFSLNQANPSSSGVKEKNRNSEAVSGNVQIDAQSCQQLLLQAELRAKRKELEELMRKDQGQTSAINQDICSDISADKSELLGYSHITADGTTTNATWGGSTQGTLDDLGEQDNDIQEQSAGYSSDEARDEDEEESYSFGPFVQSRSSLVQLTNNRSQQQSSSREMLNLSMDSGRLPSSTANNSQTGTPRGSCRSNAQPKLPMTGAHNVWHKDSEDNTGTLPRAVWTPSHARQENMVAAEELVADNSAHSLAASVSGHPASWWQQQAYQLQHQLEVTTTLCQTMLLEQQHMLGNVPAGISPFHITSAWGQLPMDSFQLYSSQFQQQQLLLTLSQCCNLLWLQQRELAALQASMHVLQGKMTHEDHVSGEAVSPPGAQEPAGNTTSANTSRAQPQAESHQIPAAAAMQQQLKLSFSTGLFPGSLVAASPVHYRSGVSSAQSLPNLFSGVAGASQVPASPSPTPNITFSTPNRIPHLMIPSSFAQCGQPAAPDSWAVPAATSQPNGVPPLIHPGTGSVVRGPPVTLNNQVPPGIRANNYWDNFRSYSRQNLLSTRTKSNEGFSHSPSPLVDRSHNYLRTSSIVVPSAQNPSGTPIRPNAAMMHQTLCKEKLNTNHQNEDFSMFPHVANNSEAASFNVDNASSSYTLHPTPSSSSGMKVVPHPHPPSSSGTERSIQKTDSSKGNGMCDDYRDTVYSEVAALISVNETCPQYLIEMFRKLQLISCDPLRQRALRSIHNIISRYMEDNTSQCSAANQLPQNEDSAMVGDPTPCGSIISSDEDCIKQEEVIIHRAQGYQNATHQACSIPESSHQSFLNSGQGHRSLPDLSCGASSQEQPETSQDKDMQEGAAALLSSQSSPISRPQGLPRNAVWNIKGSSKAGSKGPTIINGKALLTGTGRTKMDSEVQTVLMELLPFLKAHLDETCSPTLLSAVRRLILQLIPPVASSSPNSGGPQRLSSFFQSQLDALLEDALHKFQGCRLRDVCEELLAIVAEVLLSELTFLKLVDTVGRNQQPPGQQAAVEEGPKNVPVETVHAADSDVGLPAPSSSAVPKISQLDDLSQVSKDVPNPTPDEMLEEQGAVGPHILLPSSVQQSPLAPSEPRLNSSQGSSSSVRNRWPATKNGANMSYDAETEAEVLGCNGDLAEADQSHEDRDQSEVWGVDLSAELDGSSLEHRVELEDPLEPQDSFAEGIVYEQNSQAEGIGALEDSSSEAAEDELVKIEERIGAVCSVGLQNKTEDEVWEVEQDRELGLDQVPTRLSSSFHAEDEGNNSIVNNVHAQMSPESELNHDSMAAPQPETPGP